MKFLIVEGVNYEDYPSGGQLSTAKQLMKLYKSDVALVGLVTDDGIVGQWTTREFMGEKYNFFGIAKVTKAKMPIIPTRLVVYLGIRKYFKKIMELKVYRIFVQSPEALLAIPVLPKLNVCIRFPGVKNPLKNSRYFWSRMFANWFEYQYIKRLKNVRTILASADKKDITVFVEKLRSYGISRPVEQFRTRYDEDVFFPIDKHDARKMLGIGKDGKVFVINGRINRGKGWPFILQVLEAYGEKHGTYTAIFVGTGEDEGALLKEARLLGIQKNVRLTGNVGPEKVALYINAADIVLVASEVEGMSLAVIEALACGRYVVSVNVGSVAEIIRHKVNGIIVENRNIDNFVAGIYSCLSLEEQRLAESEFVEEYSLVKLRDDLEKVWGDNDAALSSR